MKEKPDEVNRMKAERVQFWARLVEATRSTACKVCDFLDAVIAAAQGLKTFFSHLIHKS